MSHIKENRMKVETAVLKKYFPKFKWIPADGPERLEVELKTNSGNLYQLTLYLPSDYPNSQPEMVISDPCPLSAYDEDSDYENDDEEDDDDNDESNGLLNVSGSMHTLGPIDGCVQICHYRSSNWSPRITLYKVILKGRIWLEAYEIYLKTGNDIDTYLPHQ